MIIEETSRRVRVLLSLQRALLGEVSSALRGVTADWHDNAIDIVCYFDGPIAEQDEESMGCVDAEVLADFPEHTVNFRIIRSDTPEEMKPLRAWVYRRRE